MTTIGSTTQYIKNIETENKDDFINALEVAKQRINNLSDFTKRFTDVVRIPKPEMQDCDLIEVVRQQLVYFHAEFENKKIAVKTFFEGIGQITVRFDVQQLELVLANILKNAVQAIDTGGNINIRVHTSPLALSIENNGEPITREVGEKLFTPFFTTKKTGQGIGLTLTREILLNHNCRFSLKTRDDGITEFRIVFGGKISIHEYL